MQILVRLHPIYFAAAEGGRRHGRHFEALDRLRGQLLHSVLDVPEVLEGGPQFDMPRNEAAKVTGSLRHSDVLLSHFSSMMIEASFFDLPIVNTALFSPERQSLENQEQMVHITRVTATGAIRTVYTEGDMLESVRQYLGNRCMDREARACLAQQEGGPNRGRAGRAIGRWLAEEMPRCGE